MDNIEEYKKKLHAEFSKYTFFPEKQFPMHFMNSARNIGASKKLRDNVDVLVFYVDDTVSKWDEESKAAFQKALVKALSHIKSAAESRCVNLKFRIAMCHTSVDFEVDVETDNVGRLMKKYNKKNATEYQSFYEEKYGVDEAPVILAVNKNMRSFAGETRDFAPKRDEYSVIGKTRNGLFLYSIIAHELLHQFGAQDYYYPQAVADAARKYLPKSIMNDGDVIDSVSQWAIGWRDCFFADREAYLFFEETANITTAVLNEAREAEWKKWK